jgi:hypothetical protein
MATAKLVIILTFAYLFSAIVSEKYFVKYLVSIMTVLAALSLFAYTLVNGLDLKLPLPVYTNANGIPYLSGFLFFVYDNHLTYRNMGPFWEPGIFGTYLSLTIFILLNNDYKYKKMSLLILVITLITTMSTAAMIFLFLLICYWVASIRLSASMQRVMFLLGISSAILLFLSLGPLLGFLAEVFPSLFSKFTAAESMSVGERVASPITNLEIFASNPYFGLGLIDALTEYSKLTYASQLSTPTFFLAAFGVGGGVYSLAWLYGLFRQKNISVMAKLILFVFIFSFLNKEPHYYFSLTYILMFYLLLSHKKYGSSGIFNLNNSNNF